MRVDKRKLVIAISAVWVLASIPISQHLYDEVLSGGLFMRVFALVAVAAPVWAYFGWLWLSEDAPIRRIYLGVILVLGVMFSLALASESYYDDIAYIPTVVALMLVVLAVIGDDKIAAKRPTDPLRSSAGRSLPIHPDKLKALQRLNDQAVPLLALTERIANEIQSHLQAIGGQSPLLGMIHMDADSVKVAHGVVYGAYTSLLHNGGSTQHTAVLTFYASQMVGNLTALSMPRIPGVAPLSPDDLTDDKFREPVRKLMRIEEENGKRVKQRLLDKVRNPYYPLYENLRPYVSSQATEDDMAATFEAKFESLYKAAKSEVLNSVLRA